MSNFITFLVAFVYFLVLQLLDWDNILTIGMGVVIILAGVLYPLLKNSMWETRVEKLENFLLKNKNKPDFYIIYALANELDEEVKANTELLLKRASSSHRKALYKVVEALYFKNIDVAKYEVEKIKPGDYRFYYEAKILLEEGNIESANKVIDQISKPWMKHALLAEQERRLNHPDQAKRYAQLAKQQTKGLQRYLLHKTYQREFGTD